MHHVDGGLRLVSIAEIADRISGTIEEAKVVCRQANIQGPIVDPMMADRGHVRVFLGTYWIVDAFEWAELGLIGIERRII
jgi:hypothetical protein